MSEPFLPSGADRGEDHPADSELEAPTPKPDVLIEPESGEDDIPAHLENPPFRTPTPGASLTPEELEDESSS